MKKLVVWLVIGFFFFGLFYFFVTKSIEKAFYEDKYRFRSAALVQELNALDRERAIATVVYATKDMAKGATFTRQDGIELSLVRYKIPEDAITSLDLVAGQKLAFGIKDGQILSIHEFEPSRKGRPLWFYQSVKDIPKGTAIESGDLGISRFDLHIHERYGSIDASKFEYNPIGKKAKVVLKKGTILRVQDIEQN